MNANVNLNLNANLNANFFGPRRFAGGWWILCVEKFFWWCGFFFVFLHFELIIMFNLINLLTR